MAHNLPRNSGELSPVNTDLVAGINQSMEIELAPGIAEQELREQLAGHINHLINTNFEKLVFYLYRIDVNENKMRAVLDKRQDENAGTLIADLIIERQQQKIQSRQENNMPENKIPDEEKW